MPDANVAIQPLTPSSGAGVPTDASPSIAGGGGFADLIAMASGGAPADAPTAGNLWAMPAAPGAIGPLEAGDPASDGNSVPLVQADPPDDAEDAALQAILLALQNLGLSAPASAQPQPIARTPQEGTAHGIGSRTGLESVAATPGRFARLSASTDGASAGGAVAAAILAGGTDAPLEAPSDLGRALGATEAFAAASPAAQFDTAAKKDTRASAAARSLLDLQNAPAATPSSTAGVTAMQAEPMPPGLEDAIAVRHERVATVADPHPPAEGIRPVDGAPASPHPAGPTPSVSIASAVGSAEWRYDVVREISQFLVMRHDTAELRLTPEELGPVMVRVAMEGGQANLLVTAPQATTRDALELALPQLRDSLAQQGITLGQASVQDEGSRSPNDRPAPAEGPGRPRAVGPLVPERPLLAPRGLVDVFA